MKNARQNAERWIREAEYTLRQTERNCREGSYNLACFLAEQTAQKALKAVLYFDGARFINIHSVAELAKEASGTHQEFTSLISEGSRLDQYYLSARYPDAVPEPAIPAEIFTKKKAEEAGGSARKIFDAAKGLML